ncbi:MAG: hypothetical protein PHN41_06145 [Bacteroidales bacterium]|nr:hypothetical protein [Bacteroidales bacterium]
MMRESLLIILMLSATISYAQKPKNADLNLIQLNGQVKYLEETIYADLNYDGKVGQNEIGSYEFTKFHKNGNIDVFLYRSKFLFFRYQYISMNEITQAVQFDEKGAIESMETYTYDKNGNKTEYVYYEGGVVVSKTQYIYDNQNNNIETSALKSNGERGTRYLYKYDSLNNKTEAIQYNSKGDLVSTIKYEYNPAKDEYRYVSYLPTNEIEWIRTYKSDSKGNKVVEYKYNSKGELKDKFSWQYVYDKNNNWTKQTEYNEDGKIVRIIQRKIVYFGDKDENKYSHWDNPNYKGRKL